MLTGVSDKLASKAAVDSGVAVSMSMSCRWLATNAMVCDVSGEEV
jgi:hypothetical protein